MSLIVDSPMWIVESDLLSKKSTVRFRLVDLFDDQIGHRPIPTTPAFAGYTHSLEKREKTHVKIGSKFWPRILQFLSVVFPQSKSTAWPSTRGIVTKFGRRNGVFQPRAMIRRGLLEQPIVTGLPNWETARGKGV